MSSSGRWGRMVLVRVNVSEERIVPIFRVKIINELGNMLMILTLKIEAVRSSETSLLTRARQCHIAEDDILHYIEECSLRSCPVFKFWK
jgi:hypothetical protein